MRVAELHEALKVRARVRLAWGYPHDHSETRATGRVVGYSEKPMVLIETDDGKKVWWAAELTHPAAAEPPPPPPRAVCPCGWTRPCRPGDCGMEPR